MPESRRKSRAKSQNNFKEYKISKFIGCCQNSTFRKTVFFEVPMSLGKIKKKNPHLEM